MSRALSALAPAQEDLKEYKEVIQAGENPNQQKMLDRFQLARFSVIQGDSLKRLKSRVFSVGPKRATQEPTARKLPEEYPPNYFLILLSQLL